ncbi:MAG: c-type cytochrome [Deltaproteobacteria bacterium]|nr:c-type cytochrome [Deltaproteobacteria bacterium]
MAKETDPIELKSYSKWLFVLGSLFFAVSVWAFYSEMIDRRSWKRYQREFNTLELKRVEEEYAKTKEAWEIEDKRRDQLPMTAEREDDLSLRQIRLKIEQAEVNMESPELLKTKDELQERKNRLSDGKQRYGFAKADQDEVFYEWKHALEHKKEQEAAHFKQEYTELEAKIREYDQKVKELESWVAEVQSVVTRYEQELKKWKDKEKVYLEPFDKLEKKKKAIRSRGLEIQQVVIDDLGKGGVISWGAVDRCESCHVSMNRDGFENEKNPFKTHPHRSEIFGAHPISEFGCTTCHQGQGRATQIKGEPMEEGDFVHGFEHHWPEHLLRGDALQSSCNKCHQDQWQLNFAPVYLKGKKLFWDLGCTGCHAVKGFEEAQKIAPSLLKVRSKVDPEWLIRWIKHPEEYLPETNMPTPPVDIDAPGQTEKIAAYLLQSSSAYSFPFGQYPGGSSQEGKRLFETVGCIGCHTLKGQGSALAPALDRIMEKTTADWIYNWIQDPKTYNPDARMPDLRLTSQEAANITAFLTKENQARRAVEGEAPSGSAGGGGDASPYDDPEEAKEGFLLVSQFGCYGCHAINGFEKASRLSVELTDFGKKEVSLLDFGDTEVPRNWEDWLKGKLKNPRMYLNEKTSSKMPNFRLKDDEIDALVLFLKGLKNEKVPPRYLMTYRRPEQQAIDEGRRLVERLNCRGCHVIEGEGGLIQQHLAEGSAFPPILDGIGARVRPEFMFKFLKDPSFKKIRPWVDVRMPTFGFDDQNTNRVLQYFSGLSGVRSDFYSPTHPPSMSVEDRVAAENLISPSYFSCYSCHARNNTPPPGSPTQWGPDLALVRERIRPEFIPEWLKDPQRFTPGVVMPGFLPDDSAAPQDILGGNSKKQAEVIRDYLLNLNP